MLAQGMKRGELRFKYDCERYAADGDMLQEKCDKGVAVVLPVREELGLDEHRHVMYSGGLVGPAEAALLLLAPGQGCSTS